MCSVLTTKRKENRHGSFVGRVELDRSKLVGLWWFNGWNRSGHEKHKNALCERLKQLSQLTASVISAWLSLAGVHILDSRCLLYDKVLAVGKNLLTHYLPLLRT